MIVRLFPTPQAVDTKTGSNPAQRLATGRQINLADIATTLLPTPTSSNPNDGECPAHWLARQARHRDRPTNATRAGIPLAIAICLLPTPRASDGTKGSPNQRGSAGDLTLSSTIARLPSRPATSVDQDAA